MREINDYDTVWESRMECTGDKQVVDSIRYAKTSTIPMRITNYVSIAKVTPWHAKATTYVT